MSFELKEGQGTLHKNDKEGNDKRPDYRGTANVGGTLYRVSGWIKEGKNGKWMSLSIELPRASETEPAPSPKKHVDVNEDIPF